jgi:hypothetical protein
MSSCRRERYFLKSHKTEEKYSGFYVITGNDFEVNKPLTNYEVTNSGRKLPHTNRIIRHLVVVEGFIFPEEQG